MKSKSIKLGTQKYLFRRYLKKDEIDKIKSFNRRDLYIKKVGNQYALYATFRMD